MRLNTNRKKHSHRGFTLVELAVVVAVVSILSVVAMPNFESFMTNQRLKRVSQTLLVDILYARSEAIKLNIPVYIYPNAGDWNAGWSITTVEDKSFADCLADSTDCLRMHTGADQSKVLVTGGVASIRFGQMGRAASAATFTVCDNPATDIALKRVVRMELSGHASTTQEGQCA